MLDEREAYYKRIKVPVLHFEGEKSLGDAYVYSSLLDARWIERDITRALPLWRDVVYARTGSYRISKGVWRDI